MSNIESLHFEVILDHTKFDQEVKKVKKLAHELNTEVSKALDLKKKISDADLKLIQNAEKQKQAVLQTAAAEQKVRSETEKATAAQQKGTAAVKQTNTTLLTTSSLMRTISQLTGVAFGVVGIRRFLSSLIDITGQFEVQRMALRNMLQDIDAADKIYQDLYRFSSESTYRFSELAKYAKQLAAFNIPKEDLLETTKMLGDVASGVGVSMDRIILAYGHVKSSGFLRGIQLRSFAQNGVPILEELANQFSEIEKRTVSLGEVFDKMMRREIPFEMVEEGFRRMTSEGGKFYQMQEVLAKTLAGQINILKGRWENLLAAMGEANSGVLKGTVSWISELISSTENFGHLLTEAAIAFGAYKAGILLGTIITEGFGTVLLNVGIALEKFYLKLMNNPWAIVGATIAAVSLTIYQLYTNLDDVQKIYQVAEDGIKSFNSALVAEQAELDRLYARLRLAKEGTEEYASAKHAIEGRFGSYIQELREEGVAVDNLAELYGKLAGKITEALQAKFLESESANLAKQLDNATKNIYESFKKTADSVGWTIAQQEDIWRYIVTGELSDKTLMPQLSRMGGGTIGLPGTWTYRDLGRSAASLRADMKAATDAYNFSMKSIEEVFNYKREGGGGSPMKDVADDFEYNVESIVAGIQKLDKEIERIRNKAKKGSITQSEKDLLDEHIKDRAAQAALYKDIMGIDYDKDNKKKKSGGSGKKYTLDEVVDKMIQDTGEDINKDIAKQSAENLKVVEKVISDRDKALTKYQDFYRKWAGKDFSKHGTGVLFDLTSARTDRLNKDAAADDKYREGVEMAKAAYGGDKAAIDREIARLRALRDLQKEMNKSEYYDKIVSLAPKVLEEGMFGYDLTDWGDKTLSQINEIRDALMGMEIPESIKEELKADDELLKLLIEEVQRLAQEKVDKTVDPERWKKVAKQAKYIAQRFVSVANSLKEFADASGNSKLSQAADAVGRIAQNVKAAEEGAKAWGGWWGAIIGGGTDIIEQVLGGLTESTKEAAELRDTLREAFTNSQISNFKAELEKAGASIFGENTYSEVNEAVNKLQDLRAKIANMSGIGQGTNNWQSLYKTNGNFAVEFTKKAETLFRLPEMWNIYKISAETGMDILDNYGNFNVELLNWIKNAGWDLTNEEKDWLDTAIEYSTNYAEGMTVVENAMASLFDQMASDAADKIIDSWIEAGNAALDYADILDDVAKSYAKMIIQSTIIDTAFKPIEKDLIAAFSTGRKEDAMAMIANAMQSVADAAPLYEDILEAFDPYFLHGDGSGSGSLGSGIKSITEDTANLLASYLNAIRADVSYMRGLQEKGWSAVGLIGETIPTLNDYLNEIAANTFNNAQDTNRILSELRSVIGYEGSSGQIVRVEVVG